MKVYRNNRSEQGKKDVSGKNRYVLKKMSYFLLLFSYFAVQCVSRIVLHCLRKILDVVSDELDRIGGMHGLGLFGLFRGLVARASRVARGLPGECGSGVGRVFRLGGGGVGISPIQIPK